MFELPMDLPVVRSKVAAQFPLSAYDAELRTDASFLYADRVVGAAWQLVIRGVEGTVHPAKRRYGKGPVFAEMMAIGLGMRSARKEGINRLILKTDSQWCSQAILGLVTPRIHYMVDVSRPVLALSADFEVLAVVHTRTKNIKHVDRAARRAADLESARVRRVEEGRQAKALAAFERAQTVSLVLAGNEYIADGYARVTLNPPSCTCKGWSDRWANVPIEGKRARRIPCKHLAAVALRSGISDPVQLLQLARLARS